jgi:hypothetical protein
MTLSNSSGFLFVSACPYQYTRGNSAFEDRAVGADVAADPSGLAGEHVGRGECTGAADIAPGQDQPP